MRFTQSRIAQLDPHPPRTIRDVEVPGLQLRIRPSGAHSWAVFRRVQGRPQRVTLGRWALKGGMSVEIARSRAQAVLGDIAKGKNPMSEKRGSRASTVTLREAFETMMAARAHKHRERTVETYREIVEFTFKAWLDRSLTSIAPDDVQKRHQERSAESKARADGAFRVLRAIINHARSKLRDADGRPLIVENPVSRLTADKLWNRVPRKKKLVPRPLLKDFVRGIQADEHETVPDCIYTLLITGLRREEVAQWEWKNINFRTETVFVPDGKGGLTHELPLGWQLIRMLRRRAAANRQSEHPSRFVFPGDDGPESTIKDPRPTFKRIAERSGVLVGCHDLRRTFLTAGEAVGVGRYTLKRLANHAMSEADPTEGYIHLDVESLREAAEKIAFFITGERRPKKKSARRGLRKWPSPRRSAASTEYQGSLLETTS